MRKFLFVFTVLLAQTGLAQAKDDVVVVLDSGDARVTLIDQNTRQSIGSFATGKEPHHLMATPNNQDLIVANAVSGDLMLLNPQTGKPIGSVPDIPDPYQIGFSPDHRWFVVNCLRLNRVDIYSYDQGKLLLAKRIPLKSLPSHMAFTADSKTVYISLQETNSVAAIDLPTQTVMWTLKVGETPAGLWLTPGDKTLLVALTGSDAVVAVDPRTRTVFKRIVTGKAARVFDDVKAPVVSINGDLWPVNTEANQRHMHLLETITIQQSDHFRMLARPHAFNQALEQGVHAILRHAAQKETNESGSSLP